MANRYESEWWLGMARCTNVNVLVCIFTPIFASCLQASVCSFFALLCVLVLFYKMLLVQVEFIVKELYSPYLAYAIDWTIHRWTVVGI